MPNLAEAQSKGLALWTFGTITAQSGCRNAVIAALAFMGGFSAVRQRLREWLCDGADRSKPGKWIDPACELLDPLVGSHSHDNAGNRDGGSRLRSPKL